MSGETRVARTPRALAFAAMVAAGAMMSACFQAAPRSAEGAMSLAQVRDLTDEERVSRAVAILETIPVAGYCREVPPLEEVIRSSGCCSFVTKVAELNGTSYREDERGEIVEMTYSCVGLDGGRYIAAILVDLETAGMAPIYSDPNARHLSYTVGGGSFPEARGSE